MPKEEWWVDGCLLIDYVSKQYFIHAYGNSVNESDKVNEEGCLRFFAYEVDPETVCQYTGLTDKNGRKIFENDIVSAPFTGYAVKKEERKGVVEFVNGAFSVNWNDSEEYGKNFVEYVHEIKVIGNIFDNQEILQETNSE